MTPSAMSATGRCQEFLTYSLPHRRLSRCLVFGCWGQTLLVNLLGDGVRWIECFLQRVSSAGSNVRVSEGLALTG